MTTMTASPSAQNYRVRAIVAASIGNALEWFDFAVYGFFAVTMAKLFFPRGDDTVALLANLLLFGVPFFIRPLGALLLGDFADRRGRRAALTLTIGLMMLGTALIAFAPTYAMVGVLAPLVILVARLIQGFSAGGEFGSATAFLAEQNPAQRGFFASWQFASQGLTTILATAFGATLASNLTVEQMDSWGWRAPFIFGLLIGPVAWYIRTRLEETVEYKAVVASHTPLMDTFKNNGSQLLIGIGLVVLSTVGTYTISLYMPTYAVRQLGLPASGSYMAALLTGAVQLVCVPIVGALSDRIGRTPIAMASALLMILIIYPLFTWLVAAPTIGTLLVVQAIGGLLMAGYLGGLPALLAELFPTRLRTTGLSISYAFAVAIFGGGAPFLNTWLIQATGSNLVPSYYLIFAAAISLIALLAARSQTARPLQP